MAYPGRGGVIGVLWARTLSLPRMGRAAETQEQSIDCASLPHRVGCVGSLRIAEVAPRRECRVEFPGDRNAC